LKRLILGTPENFNKNPTVYGQVTSLDLDMSSEVYAAVYGLIVTYITICIISLFARSHLNDEISEKIINRGKEQ